MTFDLDLSVLEQPAAVAYRAERPILQRPVGDGALQGQTRSHQVTSGQAGWVVNGQFTRGQTGPNWGQQISPWCDVTSGGGLAVKARTGDIGLDEMVQTRVSSIPAVYRTQGRGGGGGGGQQVDGTAGSAAAAVLVVARSIPAAADQPSD